MDLSELEKKIRSTMDTKSVLVVAGSSQPEEVQHAVELLVRRVRQRSEIEIAVVTSEKEGYTPNNHDLTIIIGVPDGHPLLGAMMEKYHIELPMLPDTRRAHPEGYTLRTVDGDGGRILIIAGVDGRGTLYGVGGFLRSIFFGLDSISVPDLNISDRPAFWIRGSEASSTGPRGGAIELGRLRPQTQDEGNEAIEDLMLLGANIFQGQDDFVRSRGMMTYSGNCANALPGEFSPDWSATPSNSLHIKVNTYFRSRYVCPSIPEARQALLEHYERTFSEMPPCDFFTTASGDVAGCTCERCMPWGETFIRLTREMASVLHKYQPDCRLIATNQNLTDEGDQAMLDFLNSEDPSWFYALRYGPGGNEMSNYNRGPLNPAWFRYPGFGWVGNYLKYLHHQLPRDVEVLLFSDITHWIRSQYGVQKPDVALAVIYNRRTWNARPRALHSMARETLHYCIGDMYYSEGIHDDFNKWLWHRMLWNPQISAEAVTREYCRYWFGPEAEEEMAEAIFLMEDNMGRPVLGNRGIPRAVEILREAGAKIPPNLKEMDYRWGIFMQKALLDRYIQLRLAHGEGLKKEAANILRDAGTSGDPGSGISESLRVLGRPAETPEMMDIRLQIEGLGEDTNDRIGYREPSIFDMNEFDVTEIGWWKRVLGLALQSGNDGTMRETARMVLHYEDPGEGGHYERVGWPWDSEHLVEHHNIIGYFPFSGPAMLHHYGMGYSWGKDAMMTFVYHGLDPRADHVVRISTGFHCDGLEKVGGQAMRQRLWLNGTRTGEDFPLPLGEIRVFEFDVPPGTIKDGRLEIKLSATGEFPAVGLNGIWLMRREHMTWSARNLNYL